MKKRVLWLLLALAMCLSLLPATAFAEDGDSAGAVADLVYHGGKGAFSDSVDKKKTLPGELKTGEPYTLKTAEELGLTGPEKYTFFAGWTLDKSAKDRRYWAEMTLPEIVTQVTAETTEPVTVYAVWDSDWNKNGVPDRDESLTVTFDSNKEVFSECFDAGTHLLLPGAGITMPSPQSLNPSKAVGVGWSLTPCKKLLTIDDDLPEDMAMVNEYKVTEDITFYAVWSLDTDQNGMGDVEQKTLITYWADGAQNVPEDTIATWKRQGTAEPYTYTPLPISDQIPSKEGYEFKGWYNKDRDVQVPRGVTSLTLTHMPFSETRLDAVWERKPGYQVPYSVSFEAEDVEPEEVPETLTKKVEAESCTFTLPETVPTREDAKFICWAYFDREIFQEISFVPGAEITLQEDHPHITLTAKWEKVYRAVFDDFQANKGTVPETIYISQDNKQVASFTLPETPVPERQYYKFTGYKICILGGQDDPGSWLTGTYYPGERVDVRPRKDYVVVPQWEALPDELIILCYNSNGGYLLEIQMEQRVVSSGEAAEFTVTDQVPEWSGHIFKEWNTEQDGTGTAYCSGETLSIDKDITLYAQWGKDPDDPDKPDEPAQPGTPAQTVNPSTPAKTGVPATGDSTKLPAEGMMALLSGVAAVILWRKRARS